MLYYAEAATTGADGAVEADGAESFWLAMLLISTSAPLLLFSLFSLFSLSIWLLSLFSLLLSPDADPSELPSTLIFGGAFHRGISQTTPVKLLSLKLPFCHLRHGLPVRSRARRPALMAP